MFDALFPGWSNPALVATTVALRFVLYAALVALVARATGPRSRSTVVAAALTALSAVLMVSVVGPGGAGRLGSWLELAFQAVVLALAGYATYSNPSTRRWVALAAVSIAVLALLLPAIVLYGEATVAP